MQHVDRIIVPVISTSMQEGILILIYSLTTPLTTDDT